MVLEMFLKVKVFTLLTIYIAILTGCAYLDEIAISTPGAYTVTITTEPSNARVVMESMGNRKPMTFYTPAKIQYSPRPNMPSVISVSKSGYTTQNIRLDPHKTQIHLVLQQASAFQYDMGNMGGMSRGMAGRPDLGQVQGTTSEAPPADGMAPKNESPSP